MTWEGYPLHYVAKHGWGFLVPKDDVAPKEEKKNGTSVGSEDDENEPEIDDAKEIASRKGPVFPIE